MKKYVQLSKILFFSFFLGLLVFNSTVVNGQTCPPFADNALGYQSASYYDGFQDAWRTRPSMGSATETRNWESTNLWQKFNKATDTWENSTTWPPFNVSGGNQNNQLYIEIVECVKVNLNQSLNYRNQVTLRICGSLSISNFVIIVTPDVETVGFSFNFNTNLATLTGNFKSWDPIIETGFFVSTTINNFDQLIINGTKIVAASGTDLNPNPTANPVSISAINDLLTVTNFSRTYSGPIYYVAYAIASFGGQTAIGYGSVNTFDFTPSPGGKSLNLQVLSGTTSTFNNLTLIVCNNGSFNVATLTAGNGATITNRGSMEIGTINLANNATLTNTGTLTTNIITFGNGGTFNQLGTLIISENGRVGMDTGYCIHLGENSITYTNPPGGVPNLILTPNPKNDPTCENILPIELLSFTSKVKSDRIDLHFTTGTEINNDYFTLERSRDLNGWEVLGHVTGAGNSSIPLSYTFSDLRPMEGVTYYRLKQTDFDGKFEYFRPIAVHYDLGMEGLEFKVIKQFSNWIIAVPNDGIYQVEVYNLMGHRLSGHKVKNNLVIPAPEGAVVIRVTDGYSRTASRVVM